MKEAELENTLHQLLLSKAHLNELLSPLQQYKAAGGSQAVSLALLERLRAMAANEQVEDRILEIMDIITGYCSPKASIW